MAGSGPPGNQIFIPKSEQPCHCSSVVLLDRSYAAPVPPGNSQNPYSPISLPMTSPLAPLIRCLAIPSIAALTCVSLAHSQIEIPWGDQVVRSGAVHFGVEALPDGGSLAAVGFNTGVNTRQLELRRLSENGTRLWRAL